MFVYKSHALRTHLHLITTVFSFAWRQFVNQIQPFGLCVAELEIINMKLNAQGLLWFSCLLYQLCCWMQVIYALGWLCYIKAGLEITLNPLEYTEHQQPISEFVSETSNIMCSWRHLTKSTLLIHSLWCAMITWGTRRNGQQIKGQNLR